MARLVISLLGPFQATLDGQPISGFESNKVRALLAYLAAEMDRAHPREALAELLWPEQPATASLGNLRNALANLRSAIQDRTAQPPFLLVASDTLQLNAAADLFVDLACFNTLAVLDRPYSLEECREAVELARGGFLEGFAVDGSPAFEEWTAVVREQVDRRLVRLLARLIRRAVEEGDFVYAESWTRRQLALQPWNEEVHRQLIWLLAVSGQRATALRQVEACRRMLAQELDVDPSPETEALAERVRSGDGDLSPIRGQDGEFLRPAPPKPRHNLPHLATPFFGREAELALIAAHLADPGCRLLTVVGPGGVGKTRLALQAAAQQVDCFADGVVVVFLAAVVQGELLTGEILRALDAPASGAGDTEARLRDCLHDKEMLLVLDNFEQLAESSPFLAELLAAAPRLKILVTARERLRLSMEWLVPLEGLDTPDLSGQTISGNLLAANELESLEHYSAVELFVHAGRRVQPGFALTSENAAQVARICRLLDGFPLALELAAAWVRLLPVEEVLAELERSSALLATTMSDVPERHRSMEAVFDRSWNLLTPREHALLRQLAVFRGGFTRGGAQDVAGATVVDLAALVDKSWLRVSSAGRYGMHELVRQYCEARLEAEHEAASGEPAADVRRRHCSYIAGAMREALRKLNFRRDAYDEIIPELGNLQAAWRYAVENLDSDAGRQIALGIWFSADVLGWFTWAIQTLELGAVALEDRVRQSSFDPETAHRAALVLVWIRDAQRNQYVHLGRTEGLRTAVDKLGQTLQWLEPGDALSFWQLETISRRGAVAYYSGDYGEALRLHQQLKTLFDNPPIDVDQLYGTHAGLLFFQAEAARSLAFSQTRAGYYLAAHESYARGLALSQEIGEGRFRGYHLGEFARLALIMGDLSRAEEYAQEGLRLVRSFDDKAYTTRLQVACGLAAAAAGRADEARGHLLQSVESCSRLGMLVYHLEGLTALGRLALAQGDLLEARRRFEEAVAVFNQAGTAHCITLVGAILGLGWTALAEGNLAEARDTFTRILAAERGRAAWETMEAIAGLARVLHAEERWEEAVELLALVAAHRFTAYALRRQAEQWLADLEADMGPDLHATHAAAGRALDLESTVASLRG